MIKYLEIEKLMPNGTYEINIPLKSVKRWLKDMSDDYDGLELDPDYQRGHVWSEKQQISYIEFLLRGGKTANVIYFNCPQFELGSCKKIKNADKLPMQCLDGLQRLTAILKFLDNELPVFNGNYLNDFEDKDILLRDNSIIKFNVNNMQTKTDILKWYIDYNSGGTIHSDEEINRVKKMLKECIEKNNRH